jgi:hypothetical protein
MGHTKGRPHTGRIGQGKETKNLMWLISSWYRNEYRSLKLVGATMGKGLGKSEEDW